MDDARVSGGPGEAGTLDLLRRMADSTYGPRAGL